MRNITEFIEQLESGKHHFSIWAYSSNGHYCQFGPHSNKLHISQLQKAIKQHLQVIVEMHNDEIDNAFLLLPEVHAVVPVNFHEGQISSMNMKQAA